MDACAVIVHYGDLTPTLAQVALTRQWASHVVVIANDGARDEWFSTDADVEWVVPQRNLGYGGAANAALNFSRRPVMVILNTDIQIPSRVARDACHAVLDGWASVVGLRMEDGRGMFLSGAGSLSRLLLLRRMREPSGAFEQCEWVTGAAMFIERRCLERTQFDERFFLGMEDVDFCCRVREVGDTVAVLNAPDVVHEGGSVIGATRWHYYAARNPIWFTNSQRGWLMAMLIAGRAAGLAVRVHIVDLLRRRGCERSRLMSLGIWHGLTLRRIPGAPAFEWEPVALRNHRMAPRA